MLLFFFIKNDLLHLNSACCYHSGYTLVGVIFCLFTTIMNVVCCFYCSYKSLQEGQIKPKNISFAFIDVTETI